MQDIETARCADGREFLKQIQSADKVGIPNTPWCSLVTGPRLCRGEGPDSYGSEWVRRRRDGRGLTAMNYVLRFGAHFVRLSSIATLDCKIIQQPSMSSIGVDALLPQ